MAGDYLLTVVENLAANGTTRPVNAKRYNSKVAGGKPCLLNVRRDGTTGTVAVFGVNLANPWRSNEVPANPNSLAAGVAQQQATAVIRGDGATLVFNLPSIAYVAQSNYNWIVDADFFDRFTLDVGMFTMSSDGVVGTNVTFRTETFSGDGSTVAFTLASTSDNLFPALLVRNPPNRSGGYFTPIVKVGGVTKTAGTDYAITAGANGLAGLVITFTVAPASGSSNITIAFAPANGTEFGISFCVPVTLWAAAANSTKIEIAGRDRVWAVGASSPSSTDVYIEPAPGG